MRALESLALKEKIFAVPAQKLESKVNQILFSDNGLNGTHRLLSKKPSMNFQKGFNDIKAPRKLFKEEGKRRVDLPWSNYKVLAPFKHCSTSIDWSFHPFWVQTFGRAFVPHCASVGVLGSIPRKERDLNSLERSGRKRKTIPFQDFNNIRGSEVGVPREISSTDARSTEQIYSSPMGSFCWALTW